MEARFKKPYFNETIHGEVHEEGEGNDQRLGVETDHSRKPTTRDGNREMGKEKEHEKEGEVRRITSKIMKD